MIKVKLFKQNILFLEFTVSNLEQAELWADNTKKSMQYGKPEGIYRETELTEEEKAQEIERMTLIENEIEVVYIKIPSQFSYTFEDITLEIEKLVKAENAKKLGENIICKVWAINDAKNLDLVQMQALFSDPSLTAIERCLRNGALQTAKALIENLDSTFFTTEEKQTILNLFEV